MIIFLIDRTFRWFNIKYKNILLNKKDLERKEFLKLGKSYYLTQRKIINKLIKNEFGIKQYLKYLKPMI